jgi:hypothetical protein
MVDLVLRGIVFMNLKVGKENKKNDFDKQWSKVGSLQTKKRAP